MLTTWPVYTCGWGRLVAIRQCYHLTQWRIERGLGLGLTPQFFCLSRVKISTDLPFSTDPEPPPLPGAYRRTGLRGGGGSKSCKCKVTGAIKA